MEDILNQLSGWPVEELRQLRDAAEQEIRQKELAADAPRQIDWLIEEYQESFGRTEDCAWAQPTSAVDAYPKGSRTTHNGKKWESLIHANVWEPGVSGWGEVTEGGSAPAEWVQPTGGHDAYNTGDQVSFNGSAYESTIDGNVWSPTDHPAGWKGIGDE